jgi:hypothetical protein
MKTIESTNETTTTTMTKHESLIWCAGFFDASGRIQISKPTKSDAIAIAITISKTTKHALVQFQRQIGGGGVAELTSQTRHHTWRWQQTGWGAGVLLESMLPWLVIKRDQAILGIELAYTINNSRNKLAPEVIARREEIRQEILVLRKQEKDSQ